MNVISSISVILITQITHPWIKNITLLDNNSSNKMVQIIFQDEKSIKVKIDSDIYDEIIKY